MVAFGSLNLNGTPKIVVSVTDKTARRPIKAAPFDIVELRIDLFSSFDLDRILRIRNHFKDFPTIATIRSNKEGGIWNKSEAERLLLFRKIMPHVDAVDIELSARTILGDVVAMARKTKKTVILSYHNFNKTPPLSVLNRIVKTGYTAGADIIKVAAFAKTQDDLQKLADFTLANNKKIVTIAMGPMGTLSRIFFPALGSLLTYAHFGTPTAPGQLNCTELSRLIRRFYPKPL